MGYFIDKNGGNCSSFPLGQELDTTPLGITAGTGVTIKNPKQLFFIDDTYFFVGQVIRKKLI